MYAQAKTVDVKKMDQASRYLGSHVALQVMLYRRSALQVMRHQSSRNVNDVIKGRQSNLSMNYPQWPLQGCPMACWECRWKRTWTSTRPLQKAQCWCNQYPL